MFKRVRLCSRFTISQRLRWEMLTPGIQKQEFINRRENFVNELNKRDNKKNRLVIVPSAAVRYMTGQIPYVFRQNTDFLYLTGCLEPDSILLLHIKDSDCFSSMIFVEDNDPHSELWKGPVTGVSRAPSFFGIDEAFPTKDFSTILHSITRQHQDCTLIFNLAENSQIELKNLIINFAKTTNCRMESPVEPLHRLRVIKSKTEQDLMRKSCRVASEAISESIRKTKNLKTEHELFATVDYACRMRGANFLAYPPVVASGNNANIIHYIRNTQKLETGQLTLMDAGCEYHGYCSDISRTWPVSGKFTEPQKTLYEIVLQVQSDLIASLGTLGSLDRVHVAMMELLWNYLIQAHVITKESQQDLKMRVVEKLCPHHVGHYLGMDVHDTSTVSRSSKLAEGMILTVEPGLYLNENCLHVQPEFRGLGIRIEDDILITSGAPEILSTCPKSVEQIELIASQPS